jgi:ribonuclease HI
MFIPHAFVDGSFNQHNKSGGIGVVVAFAPGRVYEFGRPVSVHNSMAAEHAAGAAAVNWFANNTQPGTVCVVVCDNEEIARELRTSIPALPDRVVWVTYQFKSALWPMKRAHQLAQTGAAGGSTGAHRKQSIPRVLGPLGS